MQVFEMEGKVEMRGGGFRAERELEMDLKKRKLSGAYMQSCYLKTEKTNMYISQERAA